MQYFFFTNKGSIANTICDDADKMLHKRLYVLKNNSHKYRDYVFLVFAQQMGWKLHMVTNKIRRSPVELT